MANRDEFLIEIWKTVINPALDGTWIDNVLSSQQRDASTPFSEVAPALARLLEAGADRNDLSIVSWFAAYEAAFGVLHMLDDPGLDDGAIGMIHEELLTTAPGRPGSGDLAAPRPADGTPAV